MNKESVSPPIDSWVIVLGLVGFVAGLTGSLLVHTDTAQGHLVGMFIAGPSGGLLGLILGSIFRILPVSNVRRLQALVATSVVLAIGTLYFYFPLD